MALGQEWQLKAEDRPYLEEEEKVEKRFLRKEKKLYVNIITNY